MLPNVENLDLLEAFYRGCAYPFVGFLQDGQKDDDGMEDLLVNQLTDELRNEIMEELVTLNSIMMKIEEIPNNEEEIMNMGQRRTICKIMDKLSS